MKPIFGDAQNAIDPVLGMVNKAVYKSQDVDIWADYKVDSFENELSLRVKVKMLNFWLDII